VAQGRSEAGAPLGEFGRIDRFFKPLAASSPASLGLTDDAAVLPAAAGRDTVVTTDALVEGVHFLPDDPPATLAFKALGVNVSDLVAMAADPLGYTLAIALPAARGEDWLAAFVQGLGEAQEHFGIPLLGGDSVSTPGPLTLSVTALGGVPAGRALRRGGGRPEDAVYVSGTLGDAALGLQVLNGALALDDAEAAAELTDRYRRPRPRTALVPVLRRFASAGLDVSDGLLADLGHLCRTSGLSATIRFDDLPLSPAARVALAARPDFAELPLVGGDDYEIVFSVPAGEGAAMEAAARDAGVRVARIGTLGAGPPAEIGVLDRQGRRMELARRGWVHFQQG
jgi:thiamine-monophosphate kinase